MVCRWARTCLKCQQAKVHQHSTALLATFATPDVRFDHIHIDLVAFEWMYVYVNLRGQIYQVAGSHTYRRLYCRNSCTGFPRHLDCTIWCTINRHHGSRSTVRVRTLEQTYEALGYEALSYNVLPPHGEWTGGAFPLPALV